MLQVLRNKTIIGIVLGVLVIAAAVAGYLFSTGDQQVTAGQTVIVTVTAAPVEDMYGYQFRMNYDSEELEYCGEWPTSKISDMTWVFSKSFDGYELVGGTLVGDRAGISGRNIAVCEMIFTAKKDGKLSDMALSLSKVNVVKSDDAYEEDVEGWKYKATVGA